MKFFLGVTLASLISLAFGQINATTLRVKYGAPINRETFKVRPNIEMVVNYGRGGVVCRIELPPGETVGGFVPSNVTTAQQVDDVLDEVAPSPVRGKETGRFSTVSGMNSIMTTDFEHLSISAVYHGDTRTSLAIIFKDEACRAQPPTQ